MRPFMHSALLTLIGVACLLSVPTTTAHAENWHSYRYTVADTEAAMSRHSWLAGCIVRLESDNLDPYSVGKAGELGVAQLHPRGLLNQFYAVGYTNPYSPYQSMDFLDWALERGEGPNWTTYYMCVG